MVARPGSAVAGVHLFTFNQVAQTEAWRRRRLADAGLSFFVANSFSKSMSVYGEGLYQDEAYNGLDALDVLGGALRSVHALTHGDVATAVGLNVLTVLGVAALVVIWLRWARPSTTCRAGRSSRPDGADAGSAPSRRPVRLARAAARQGRAPGDR